MGAWAGNSNSSMDGIYIGSGSTSTKIRQNKIHHFYTPNASGNSVDAINFSCFPHFIKRCSESLDFIEMDFENGCCMPIFGHVYPQAQE
jgi:hypothetical protein